MKDYYGYERFGLCTPIGALADLPELIRAVAQEPPDITRVAVYEAGLVVDPTAEKRAAVDIFMQCVERGVDPEPALSERYTRVMCGQSPVLMPAPYVELTERYGWLTGARA